MEWKAYHLMEPFGAPADDERAGAIASEVRVGIGGGKRVDPREIFRREERLDAVLDVQQAAADPDDDEDVLAPFTALASNYGKEK